MTQMFTCTRRLQFCFGHRVYRHESKCANLHGHNYVAFFTCGAKQLDDIGRVIDFGVIKQVVGGWIDEELDHGMVLWQSDPILPTYKESFPGHKLRIVNFNPTAENLAIFLKAQANRLLDNYGIECTKVVLYETENCYAEA